MQRLFHPIQNEEDRERFFKTQIEHYCEIFPEFLSLTKKSIFFEKYKATYKAKGLTTLDKALAHYFPILFIFTIPTVSLLYMKLYEPQQFLLLKDIYSNEKYGSEGVFYALLLLICYPTTFSDVRPFITIAGTLAALFVLTTKMLEAFSSYSKREAMRSAALNLVDEYIGERLFENPDNAERTVGQLIRQD